MLAIVNLLFWGVSFCEFLTSCIRIVMCVIEFSLLDAGDLNFEYRFLTFQWPAFGLLSVLTLISKSTSIGKMS